MSSVILLAFKHGRQWPDKMKAFAMNLYFHSPKAYIYLSKVLLLPSMRSQQNWLQDIVLRPRIMTTVLETLKKKIKNWSSKDQTCTLLFDEISLKNNLYYDPKKRLSTWLLRHWLGEISQSSRDSFCSCPLGNLKTIDSARCIHAGKNKGRCSSPEESDTKAHRILKI